MLRLALLLLLLLLQAHEIEPVKADAYPVMIVTVTMTVFMAVVQGLVRAKWPRWRTKDAGDIGLCAAAAAGRARNPGTPELLVVASITCLPEVHGESEGNRDDAQR
jgi:hypothetical protein